MTNEQKLKLDPQALRVLKNLTSALDDVAKALQVSNRQKPKNSELRLTEGYTGNSNEGQLVGKVHDAEYYPTGPKLYGKTVTVHPDGTITGTDPKSGATYTVV